MRVMRVRINLEHEGPYGMQGRRSLSHDEVELQTSVVIADSLKVQEVMDAMHELVDRFDVETAA